MITGPPASTMADVAFDLPSLQLTSHNLMELNDTLWGYLSITFPLWPAEPEKTGEIFRKNCFIFVFKKDFTGNSQEHSDLVAKKEKLPKI